jgi:hypothetical protein
VCQCRVLDRERVEKKCRGGGSLKRIPTLPKVSILGYNQQDRIYIKHLINRSHKDNNTHIYNLSPNSKSVTSYMEKLCYLTLLYRLLLLLFSLPQTQFLLPNLNTFSAFYASVSSCRFDFKIFTCVEFYLQ